MDDPLVSVIVPVYNGAAYLSEALASVRAQTYSPIELIVVDDGSIDASPEIAASYRPARRVRQAHQGVTAARNHGLTLSSGVLIAFLDQDDWWEPAKLRRQAAYLAEHPEVDYMTTRQRFFLSPGMGTPVGLRPELLEGDQPGAALSTLLARRALFDRLGPFDLQAADASDVDWFRRAQAAGAHGYELPDVLTHTRVHADNFTRLAPAAPAPQARPEPQAGGGSA